MTGHARRASRAPSHILPSPPLRGTDYHPWFVDGTALKKPQLDRVNVAAVFTTFALLCALVCFFLGVHVVRKVMRGKFKSKKRRGAYYSSALAAGSQFVCGSIAIVAWLTTEFHWRTLSGYEETLSLGASAVRAPRRKLLARACSPFFLLPPAPTRCNALLNRNRNRVLARDRRRRAQPHALRRARHEGAQPVSVSREAARGDRFGRRRACAGRGEGAREAACEVSSAATSGAREAVATTRREPTGLQVRKREKESERARERERERERESESERERERAMCIVVVDSPTVSPSPPRARCVEVRGASRDARTTDRCW